MPSFLPWLYIHESRQTSDFKFQPRQVRKMGTTVQLMLLLLCALVGQSLGQSLSLTSKASNCQTYCWTKWLDRDNPSGTGDYENLVNFPSNQVCPKPVGIECRTTAGAPYQSTGKQCHYFLIQKAVHIVAKYIVW